MERALAHRLPERPTGPPNERRCPRGSGAPRERGFVLVGVVMFVLALTILGLTLFGLSGYEAEATHGSQDAEAAFFAACSGIEHAKFVIAKRESLGAVSDLSTSPDPDVVYARARLLSGSRDDTVSAIPVLPPNTAIELRVLAQVGTQRRMVQANYIPQQTQNLYKRLISATEFVHVKSVWHNSPYDPLYSVMDTPYGSTAGVRHGNASTAWTAGTVIDPSKVAVEPVPLPDLGPYYVQFYAMATPIIGGVPHHFNLTGGATVPGGSNDVEFFSTTQDPANDGDPADLLKYSVLVGAGNPRISTRGNGPKTAIWLLDHGIRFNVDVTLEADPGDLLVIVSRPSLQVGPQPYFVPAGIWFFSGLDDGSDDLAIVLVSDAQIIVEQFNGSFQGNMVNYLTLFGRSAWMAGCRRNPGTDTTFWLHRANHPHDANNGLIDQLCELGVLPNAEAGGTRLHTVAGTWTELDPDNPPILD